MQGGDIGKEYRGVDHKSHCNCRFKYFDVINQVMQNMFVCENLRFAAALYIFARSTCKIIHRDIMDLCIKMSPDRPLGLETGHLSI